MGPAFTHSVDVFPAENAFHGGGVGLSPEIAQPREYSPRLLQPDHFDDVPTELRQSVQVKNDQPPTVQIDQAVGELNQFFQMQVFRPHINPSQNESSDSHYDRIWAQRQMAAEAKSLSACDLRSTGMIGTVIAFTSGGCLKRRANSPQYTCLNEKPLRRKGEGSVMDPVLSRRSVREYTAQPVPDEMVHTLLKAAMAAPSAGDERPWHFIVIDDQQIKERIPEIHRSAHMAPNAPVAILVCGDENLQKHRGFWVQDCAAATENVLIEAQQLGLGRSGWVSTRWKEECRGFVGFSTLPCT